MNLRSLDLNLIVMLDALLTERHVTRAGTRIGLSQSATSSALKRLRDMLGDELLVRTANGMEPTPRALELVEPVRQFLQQTERLFESRLGFEPACSRAGFRVRMSDVLVQLLVPALMPILQTSAPGVTLDVVHLSPRDTLAALEEGTVDLAVSMDLAHPNTIRSSVLLDDRMVCVLDKQHPAVGAMTMELFLDAPHVKVSISPTDGRYVDAALAEMGLSRRVVLNVPHWLVVPSVLRGTRMVGVMSERLARLYASDLAIEPVPFEQLPHHWAMYWHQRYDRLPAQIWLRVRMKEAADRCLARLSEQEAQQSKKR